MSGRRIRLRNVVVTALAVFLAWFVVARLWPTPRTGPGELLPPTGRLPVGRTSCHWAEDTTGASEAGRHGKREVMVHVWYPAESTTGARAPYIPGLATIEKAIGAEALRDAAGDSYDALSAARTHVIADAPLPANAARYPVILLTHGLRFNSLGYTILAEDLASQGYVVVGVDHPVAAFAVHFPDDRVTLFDEDLWTHERGPEETRTFERERVEVCAEDLVFVLDQLEQLNAGTLASPFAGRLDLDRIGVFGHSFGGRVAARACQLDSRLRAGIICDGFGRQMTVDKQPDGSTVAQPMMVQYARRVPLHGWPRVLAKLQTPGSDLEAELAAARREFCSSVTAGCYEVTFNTPGILHESFSDMPLLESGQTVETRRWRKRAMELTRSFTRAFFDRHLREQAAPLLDDVPYGPEEVELMRYNFAVE